MGIVVIGCCQLGKYDSNDVDEKHKIYLWKKNEEKLYIFICKFKRGVRNYEREVLKLIDATCKLISSSLPKGFRSTLLPINGEQSGPKTLGWQRWVNLGNRT